jgi:hypothetical protein
VLCQETEKRFGAVFDFQKSLKEKRDNRHD